MGKLSQYKVSYQKDWETDPDLRDWIKSVPTDDRIALCRVCQLVVPAHRAGLMKHTQNSKHIRLLAQNTAETYSHTDKPNNTTSTFSEYKPERKHKSEKETTCEDEVGYNVVKYNSRWTMNPLLADWLQPVKEDPTKAFCCYCQVLLRAHYTDLVRHRNTSKHINRQPSIDIVHKSSSVDAAVDSSHTFPADLAPPGDSSERQTGLAVAGAELDLQCENDDDYSAHAALSSCCRPSAKNSSAGGIQSQPLLAVGFSTGTADDGHSTLSRPAASGKKRLIEEDEIWPPAKRKYVRKVPAAGCSDAEYQPEWQQDPRLKEWICPVVGDRTKARCKFCECLLNAKLAPLLRHTASNKHCANSSKTESRKQTESSLPPLSADGTSSLPTSGTVESTSTLVDYETVLSAIKQEQLPVIDGVTNASLNELVQSAVGETDADCYVSEAVAAADGATDDDQDTGITDGRKKRRNRTGIRWSLYKKFYRREWESDPMLQGWIAPVAGDKLRAACKYCRCKLRAHYADLRHHYLSTKHNKNAEWFASGRPGELPVHVTDYGGTVVQRSSSEQRLSSCYVYSKNMWSRYRKRYRQQWEHDPQFQGWIMPVPGDDTRARCRYCRILLRAHHNDLRSHARTAKHATNVAFGRPCDEAATSVTHQLSTKLPTSLSLKSAKLTQRQKWASSAKTSKSARLASSESTLAVTDCLTFALDRPDDTLAPLPTLTNLTMFGWNSLASPETTLILQNDLHLDEQIAASLPQTPGLRFRVRKETLPHGCELTVTSGATSKKSRDKSGSDKTDVAPLIGTNCGAEITADMLSHVARSITLWEFLMLKIRRGGRGNSADRPKIADILTEFTELHHKVRSVSQQVLSPAAAGTPSIDSDTGNKTLVLDSVELARCLGLDPGCYDIDSVMLEDAMFSDCPPLIAPMRRRRLATTAQPTNSGYISSTQLVALETLHQSPQQAIAHHYIIDAGADGAEPQQYIIEPECLESGGVVQPIVVQGHVDGSGSGGGGHLVLVSENGELVLQYDPKDYPQLSNYILDDADIKNMATTVDTAADKDEANSRGGESVYIADDSDTLRIVKLHATN